MTKEKEHIRNEGFNEILLYTTPNGKVKVEIYLQNETVWLTQQKIADLFGVERSVVTKHLQNIFAQGELKKEATCANFAQVQTEGKRQVTRNIEFYNLDAIISVGYRVNSVQATQLKHQGKVEHEVAISLAEKEFEKYRIIRDKMLETDFDKEIIKFTTTKKKDE